jgi:hypothetical protein
MNDDSPALSVKDEFPHTAIKHPQRAEVYNLFRRPHREAKPAFAIFRPGRENLQRFPKRTAKQNWTA